MNRLIRLKDSEWNRLAPLVRRPPGPGRPNRPDREMLEAMIWILRTGAPWRDLPSEYGAWQSVYTRFSRFRRIAMRFEKLARNFLAFLLLASTLVWLM